MTGLPRAIIKKYGVTKKAWSVFRGQRSSPTRTKRRGETMARRHYRRSSGGGFGGFSLKKLAFGAVAGIVAAQFLGDSTLVRGAAGYFVGGGIAGAIGAVIAPSILGSFGGSSTSTTQSNGWS